MGNTGGREGVIEVSLSSQMCIEIHVKCVHVIEIETKKIIQSKEIEKQKLQQRKIASLVIGKTGLLQHYS